MSIVAKNTLDIAGPVVWSIAPMHITRDLPAPPFVISEAGHFSARSEYFVRREGETGFLFLYTQNGRGLLSYNGNNYELTPRTIVLVNCALDHEYKTHGNRWDFYWLHFTGDSMDFYAELIYGSNYSPLDIGNKAVSSFENVIDNLRYSDPQRLLSLSNSITDILAMMADAVESTKPLKGRPSYIKVIIEDAALYLKDNHWQPFDLEELASRFNLSKYHFLREFKQYTGMTPLGFVTAERISRAMVLLQTTNETIHNICCIIGFKDENNFGRKFKELTGETPREFRYRMKNKGV